METVTLSYEELDRVSVIERVLEQRLTQREAARMLGLTSRQVRRLCGAYEQDGAVGLASKHRGRPSNRRLSSELRREALFTVRSRYEGFGPTLAHEKLVEQHGLELSVETLRHWMIEDGLWTPRARRAPRIQQPRHRRPCRGELIQIDGSDHEWFEDRAARCTLLVFVDDATSALMELLFCESESAFSYFAALRSYLEQHGKPVALYSDKAGVFRVNRKEPQGGTGVTQFGRALSSLNIDIVCANTPAAKGRVERAHLTLQDRLVKELRLRGTREVDAANAFAPEFIADYNRRFARAPRSEHDAHRPLQQSEDLARVFSWQETRLVSKSLTLNYKRVLYVLDPTDAAKTARGKAIGIEERENGSLSFWHGEHELLATAFPKDHAARQGEVVDNKRLSAALEFIKEQQRLRTEAKVAKPSTTRRDARLLRAGTPRRPESGSSVGTRP
jgi:transposase